MNIFRAIDAPARRADGDTFVGVAHVRLLAASSAGSPVKVYEVVFQPGARTNWHTHTGVQWLLVVSGRIRAQTDGSPVQDVAAGDAVSFAPGEKHWHGAAPGSRGTHLAVNLDVETTWLEPVSDADYEPTYTARPDD